MKKTLFIIVIAIVAIAAAMFFKNKQATAPENGSTPLTDSTSSPQAGSVSESPVFCTQDAKLCPDGSYVGRQAPDCEFAACPAATVKGQTIIITFANGSATPNVITIKAGDTVKFNNNDSSPHWPASGPHPIHTTCPGFDSLRGLNTDESYSFTFREAKTCPWHDHLKTSINGKIEVTP